jgi:hypothetical protein
VKAVNQSARDIHLSPSSATSTYQTPNTIAAMQINANGIPTPTPTAKLVVSSLTIALVSPVGGSVGNVQSPESFIKTEK